MEISEEYIEKCITKGLLQDKHFGVLVTRVFKPEYFQVDILSQFFNFSKQYLEQYNRLPPKEIFLNSISDRERERAKQFIEESQELEIDLSQHYD